MDGRACGVPAESLCEGTPQAELAAPSSLPQRPPLACCLLSSLRPDPRAPTSALALTMSLKGRPRAGKAASTWACGCGPACPSAAPPCWALPLHSQALAAPSRRPCSCHTRGPGPPWLTPLLLSCSIHRAPLTVTGDLHQPQGTSPAGLPAPPSSRFAHPLSLFCSHGAPTTRATHGKISKGQRVRDQAWGHADPGAC